MRVCLAGGRLDVTRALGEATAADLSWWAAYFALEPFGPLEDARRLGAVGVAASAGLLKKPLKVADLMPELKGRGRARPMTPEELRLAAVACFGPPDPPAGG